MLSAYPACFIKEKEPDGYSVIFPDLGTATCGFTPEEAARMAEDCLAGWILYLREEGKEIPAPTPADRIDPLQVLKDLDDDGELAACEIEVKIVSVDAEEYARLHF